MNFIDLKKYRNLRIIVIVENALNGFLYSIYVGCYTPHCEDIVHWYMFNEHTILGINPTSILLVVIVLISYLLY
jgi:hypothetical protein